MGYTKTELKHHFGNKIYDSGILKKSYVLPFSSFIIQEVISINPSKTDYTVDVIKSDFNNAKKDYMLYFKHKDVSYIVYLMYFKIGKIDTYNIIFTTLDQWIEYRRLYTNFKKNGYIQHKEWEILNDIVSKETNFNEIYQILKKISYIILVFVKFLHDDICFSIGDTDNEQKINLYKNIIKNSFPEYKEEEITFDNFKYFVYR
jgi:hypothetical protein